MIFPWSDSWLLVAALSLCSALLGWLFARSWGVSHRQLWSRRPPSPSASSLACRSHPTDQNHRSTDVYIRRYPV